MPENNELEELRAQVAMLTAEMQSMHRQLAELGPRNPPQPDEVLGTAPAIEIDTAVTRRSWVKAAAAAAIGGTAVALGTADRVAAADTDSIKIGQINNVGSSRTVADHAGAAGAGVSFLFKTRMGAAGDTSDFPAALAGWSGATDRPHGVHGLSASTTGEGIGVVGEAKSVRGTGVYGDGWYGVIGTGTDYGVAGTGSKGSLLVNTSGFVPPISVPVEALPGAIFGESTDPFSNTGSVWCAVSKSGEWRKLAGFDTAGSLHVVEPTRVYDSRLPEPDQGKLPSGANREVGVADSRDPATGAVVTADFIPEGARAVAYNLTIDATESSGFLAVTPGTSTSSPASSINWSASNQIVANAGIVPVDSMRRLRVFCAGGGSTHFIIDITGYYL